MWKVEYLREALDDIKRLDPSQRVQVLKAVNKVAVNPLRQVEGGYGKPLSNKGGTNLAGYCKIKLLKLGLRVVYKVVRENGIMKIIVVLARTTRTEHKACLRKKNHKCHGDRYIDFYVNVPSP